MTDCGRSPLATNGAGGTADEGAQGRAPLLRRDGLAVNEGVVGGLGEHGGSELPAGVAIDAGEVHEEIARDVLGDALFEVRHVRLPLPRNTSLIVRGPAPRCKGNRAGDESAAARKIS